MSALRFINNQQANFIRQNFETPVYVYSQERLEAAADDFLAFPSAFWHSVRYAMKANANKNILKIFQNKWILLDCSSEFEAYRALNAWYDAAKLQISGQETPRNLVDLLEKWVFIVATSLKQIEEIWKIKPWANIWVRLNPWMWSWAFKAISTWGETSAFGIWHEYISEIKNCAKKYDLSITKVHIHIGSENTPESWTDSANIWLDFVREFEDVEILDLGWGFKKAIMSYEQDANLQEIWKSVTKTFEKFYEQTGRKIHLELEPGKYMVINACSVIAKVDDIVDTGENGFTFIRTNTGMTEMPRVPMYGVQQPIIVVNESKIFQDYVVVWHCCESWDILTTKLYNQEEIETISLPKVSIWDPIIIEGTWAYNASMSMKNYNSFPEAGELLMKNDGEIVEIRKRQNLEDIWRNEIEVI